MVIQTAFIGDAILGTALLEKLHQKNPKAQIDYLVRKGNEALFANHPFLNQVLVWDKSHAKYAKLLQLLGKVRKRKYDTVYTIQRYTASGILTAFSGAKHTIGYKNNPLSFLFSKAVPHRFGKGFEQVHEVDRVADLVTENITRTLPKIYPSAADADAVSRYKKQPYITIAPASVWFTKQLPAKQWIELVNRIPSSTCIYLIGAKVDAAVAQEISEGANRPTTDLTGKLQLLQTASLMQDAQMNFANDSAPVHLASAVNAPITEVYCSTVPAFGFTPLSDRSVIVQTTEKLDCRPCGMHGRSACPQGHFKCAYGIDVAAFPIS